MSTSPGERGSAFSEQTASSLDPTIVAILEKERAKQGQFVEFQRACHEAETRRRRALEAWLRVSQFKNDAIPRELTGETLHRRYAELVVDFGRVLKADAWQARVEAVCTDTEPKAYALAILRKAMEGDTAAVTRMFQEGIFSGNTTLQFGLSADRWLREGLMYEVLSIQPAPSPPLGWEGSYTETIETKEDFVKWIDSQRLIQVIHKRVQGDRPGDGSLVRNAFRLVTKLELKGMPPELLGPFTLNQELALLRNLRRLCLEPPVVRNEDPTGGKFLPTASDVPDLGECPASLPDFWTWCRRQKEWLREFRVRLGEPPPSSVAADEFRVIPEIVRQCRENLLSFGEVDIPERFVFPSLPRDQTPTGPEHCGSSMEKFIAWASAYRAPQHGIIKLLGNVEEFLAWAMSRSHGQRFAAGGPPGEAANPRNEAHPGPAEGAAGAPLPGIDPHRPPPPPDPPPPPMTDPERMALEIIRSQPQGQGITGKDLLNEMARKGEKLDNSTLTTHIIPNLKRWWGVKNRRGAGYYCDPS